jgi:hypothetical protein
MATSSGANLLQDGSITKKNSPSRNLHRLMTSLSFISHIFENLSQGKELREAVAGGGDMHADGQVAKQAVLAARKCRAAARFPFA